MGMKSACANAGGGSHLLPLCFRCFVLVALYKYPTRMYFLFHLLYSDLTPLPSILVPSNPMYNMHCSACQAALESLAITIVVIPHP